MSQHNNQSENTARRNIYFLSDAHLGSLAIPHPRMQERRLVNFLDSIKHKAEAVYLMGDIFDFWYEYKNVVPKDTLVCSANQRAYRYGRRSTLLYW